MRLIDFLVRRSKADTPSKFLGFLTKLWQLPIPPALRRWALNLATLELKLTKPGEIGRDSSTGDNVEPHVLSKSKVDLTLRTVAFYLPQFHAIPENDEFWGRGFTEWRNVMRANPLYEGHLQPKIPTDFGMYDLSDALPTLRRQIDLAKRSGVSAFCFHYYWFAGKAVMEGPIRSILQNPDIDFPFMINWANENWTRRWDGLDKEVLLRQDHSPEDDYAFIEHVSGLLNDPRYLRIDGNPVLMVYQPTALPSATETAERFRNWFRSKGFGELHLTLGLGSNWVDPESIGFDSAVHYPPNGVVLREISKSIDLLDRAKFKGRVHSYQELADVSLQNFDRDRFKSFPCVVPGWDNTARKQANASIYHGSSPERFQSWVREAAIRVLSSQGRKPEERLLFINAWNEWAEGAYLEPDLAHGSAYLNALQAGIHEAKAIVGSTAREPHDESNRKKVLLVTHDCQRSGAQLLTLGMAKTLRANFGLHVTVLALGGGPLQKNFEESVDTFQVAQSSADFGLEQIFGDSPPALAIVNSAASYPVIPALARLSIPVATLVHEMDTYLRPLAEAGGLRIIAEQSQKIIFPAKEVLNTFLRYQDLGISQFSIFHQGTYRKISPASTEEKSRARSDLGLKGYSKVFLGSGYGDYRKGFDLFVELASLASKENTEDVFVWVGAVEPSLLAETKKMIQSCGSNLVLIGHLDDPSVAYRAADGFILSSREDPFPSVLLEADAAGLMLFGFSSGGGADFIKQRGGVLREIGDVRGLLGELRSSNKSRIRDEEPEVESNSHISMCRYLFEIFESVGFGYPKVSVVVPSFNQGDWLEECLVSIQSQTTCPYEVLIFDDASQDSTASTVRAFMLESQLNVTFVESVNNHGTASWSWLPAAQRAKGEFVWIIEADDSASSQFLKRALPLFKIANVHMVACSSMVINNLGEIDAFGNDLYLEDTDFRSNGPVRVWDQYSALSRGLGWKNTILNVASSVFLREPLISALVNGPLIIPDFKTAPDWALYLNTISGGNVGYVPEQLIYHRRHPRSVIAQHSSTSILAREVSTIHGSINASLAGSGLDLREAQAKFAKQIMPSNPSNT